MKGTHEPPDSPDYAININTKNLPANRMLQNTMQGVISSTKNITTGNASRTRRF